MEVNNKVLEKVFSFCHVICLAFVFYITCCGGSDDGGFERACDALTPTKRDPPVISRSINLVND